MILKKQLKKLYRFVKGEIFESDVIVFPKYKTIYFAIPKAGSSSLTALAVDLLQDEIDPQYLNPSWKPFPFRSEEGRKYLSKKRILIRSCNKIEKAYWKFSVVRNPWSRLVSCYSEKLNKRDAEGKAVTSTNHLHGVSRKFIDRYGRLFHKDMTFGEFTHAVCEIPDNESDVHFRSQHKFITDNRGALIINYVGKLENLQQDFEYVREVRKLPVHLQLPHLLKSNSQAYESKYDKVLFEKVGERYSTDILLFGYQKEYHL